LLSCPWHRREGRHLLVLDRHACRIRQDRWLLRKTLLKMTGSGVERFRQVVASSTEVYGDPAVLAPLSAAANCSRVRASSMTSCCVFTPAGLTGWPFTSGDCSPSRRFSVKLPSRRTIIETCTPGRPMVCLTSGIDRLAFAPVTTLMKAADWYAVGVLPDAEGVESFAIFIVWNIQH